MRQRTSFIWLETDTKKKAVSLVTKDSRQTVRNAGELKILIGLVDTMSQVMKDTLLSCYGEAFSGE